LVSLRLELGDELEAPLGPYVRFHRGPSGVSSITTPS
jgi:hypothetical protein